jgi:hypothetical protein
MADTFTTITGFINSPPGQLVAGGALAGIVWKFFERVEGLLTDQTKLEIAVWLVCVKTSDEVQKWSSTFIVMFNQVFGEAHPSRVGFQRYFSATVITSLIQFLANIPRFHFNNLVWRPSLTLLTKVVVPVQLAGVGLGITVVSLGYLALCSVRWIILRTGSYRHGRILATSLSTIFSILFGIALVVFQTVVVLWLLHFLLDRIPPDVAQGSIPPQFMSYLQAHKTYAESVSGITPYGWLVAVLAMLPLFLGTFWLDIYAASGFLLKTARRLDIGFQWFTSKVDIEKKPLSAIGLVAGVLVALMYWSVAAIRHFLN